MIRRLETMEEIARLLTVEDDVEEHLPCTRGEWIQWLVSQANNPRLGIWASFDHMNDINGYFVVSNNVRPPLSRHLFVVYVWSLLGPEGNGVVLKQIKEWGERIGATSIEALVNEPRAFERYGFEEKKILIELEL